jgi:hypothetical protein
MKNTRNAPTNKTKTYKSYSRESRTNLPGKRELKNRQDFGNSGVGDPGNETLNEKRKI